jgi:hypothetical protein
LHDRGQFSLECITESSSHRILHSAPPAGRGSGDGGDGSYESDEYHHWEATYVITSGLHMHASHLPRSMRVDRGIGVCTADDSFFNCTPCSMWQSASDRDSHTHGPSPSTRSYYHANYCMSLCGFWNKRSRPTSQLRLHLPPQQFFPQVWGRRQGTRVSHSRTARLEYFSGAFDTTIPHVS